jgi:PAS domain S-box-containing protein
MIGLVLIGKQAIGKASFSFISRRLAMPDLDSLVPLLEILNQNPKLHSTVRLLSFTVLLYSFWRYVLKPSWSFHWKLFEAVEKALKAYPVIVKMADDFKPNGGHSLRDAVDRMERNQNIIQSRMYALLYTAQDAMFEADSNGAFTWVNRAWCETTGFHDHEAIGYGWLNSICSDYQANITAQWKLAIEQKRDCIIEFDLVTKADQVIPAKIETTTLREHGNVVGYMGRLTLLGSPRTET